MRARIIIAALLGAIAGVALTVALLAPSIMPTCATEDSTNCIWDVAHHGNGQGRSFINLGGTYYYTDGR